MTESSEARGGAYPDQTHGTSPDDQNQEESRPAADRRPGTSSTEQGRIIEGDDEAKVYP